MNKSSNSEKVLLKMCSVLSDLGDLEADQDMVGTLAAEVMCEAILRAVRSAESVA